ncbi:MAG: extensin family protein [Pontixanthobacter sp.]
MDRRCLQELGQSGTQFAAVPNRYFTGGCSTLNSVKLANLRGDDMFFSLTNIGPVACPTAKALAAWARFGVDRAARQILGSPLARIETMGSYACRNVAGTTRRSAHSRAEAVDVAAFVLNDGRRVSVADDWIDGEAAQRQFLRTVHRSACRRFGTVLGPDYNAAHRDHFHLEQGLNRETAADGDSGFCR